MPVFEYEVIDRDGRTRKGQREGAAEGALRTNLGSEGLFVVNIRRAGGGVATIALPRVGDGSPLRRVWSDALKRLIWRVKVTDMVLFTGQLSAMVGAGLHLLRSLTVLADETPAKHFKKAIEQIASDVEGGTSLAEAMEKHPWAFDKIYVSLTRVGEASGQLPEVLSQHTTYLEKVAQLRRKIIGALSYPAIILSVAMLILFIMVIYIVPIFANVYQRVNAPLPVPTQVLVAISQGIKSNILVAVLLMIGFVVFVYLGVQTAHGRMLLDRVKLRLPIFGSLIRKAVLAKVCRTLATLLNSGVLVLEALEITAQVAGNLVIEEAIRRASAEVQDGGTIAESFRQSGQFPSLVIQMASTGEETGKLPALLEKAALYYEQQVDSMVATLASLLEPIMIVTLGAIAGAIIIALYLPIFNLGRAMRGGGRAL